MIVRWYGIFLIVTILILMLCMFTMYKKCGEMNKTIAVLLLCAALTVFCNFLFIISDNYVVANVGFSLYSAMIDWLLIVLCIFVREYVSVKKLFDKLIISEMFLSFVDTMILMMNVLKKHVFILERNTFLDGTQIYEVVNFTPLYYIHLIFCYAIVVQIMFHLIYASVKSASIYKKKYTQILTLFSILIVADGLCVFFGVPLNGSILLYAYLALAISYYTIYYQPKKLLESMQTQIMQNASTAIVGFDEHGKCIYANDRVWELFHISSDLTYLENVIYEGKKELFDDANDYTVWTEQHVIENEIKYIEIERKNMRDEKGRLIGWYFSIKDRTEQVLFHEKEINAEKAANKAKSDFLSRVSHDIRTPVNSINGMSELISRESHDENILEYAGHIKDAVQILVQLLNDVLDYSKMEAGKMDIVDREYDTAKLIENIVCMIMPQANQKELVFTQKISENLPSVLLGDDVRVSQILLNLLSNAIKYTKKGRVELSIECEFEENDICKLYVEVNDTGIGIKEEDIPKLFNAYERMEELKNHSIQGTGLGLNIVSQLLMLMDSRLEVKSIYGVGSMFSFIIKQKVIDKTPALIGQNGKFAVQKKYEPLRFEKTVNILVVDDNMTNRVIISQLLKSSNINIDEADGGKKCLEMTRLKKYQLILMDHMMPGMDGVETFRNIKGDKNNLCKEVPVIMLTANAMSGMKEMFLREGFTDYLTKPVQPDVLDEMLKKYIKF